LEELEESVIVDFGLEAFFAENRKQNKTILGTISSAIMSKNVTNMMQIIPSITCV
jgi:hypothetical protein